MAGGDYKMIFLWLVGVLVMVGANPLISAPRRSCDEYGNCGNQLCCDGECVDWSDGCLGVDGDTLLGLGIALTVVVFLVPILCCCCCGGCAAYWLYKRRTQRKATQG